MSIWKKSLALGLVALVLALCAPAWAEDTPQELPPESETTVEEPTAQQTTPTEGAPLVLQEPEDVLVPSGETVTFTALAEGEPAYQWQYSRDNGATWRSVSRSRGRKPQVTETAGKKTNGYLYRCRISNKQGYVFTRAARLTVDLHPPLITTSPADTRVYTGEKALFTAAAENAARYQWYYRRTPAAPLKKVSGSSARTAALSVKVKANMEGWQYVCEAVNADGSAFTEPATLSVCRDLPQVLQEPEAVLTETGREAVFTVAAEGAAMYQWQVCRNGKSWSKLKGATGQSLILYPLGKDSGSRYRCAVSNGNGTVYSQAAELTVAALPPQLLSQPEETLEATFRAPVTLQVEAEGATRYQWFSLKPGAKKWAKAGSRSALQLTMTQALDGAMYYCQLSNGDGTVTTHVTTLRFVPGLLDDFIEYLKAQLNQPYVRGGQHLELTQETYAAIIERKEANQGGYTDGDGNIVLSYADAAKAFCKKRFDAGETVLYGYDCSGLGMYWLFNQRHLFTGDATANTMRARCLNVTREGKPKRGWWVFVTDEYDRATHIGYMIDDTYLIEAKGRKYGVVKTKFNARNWDCWGIPQVFADEIE